ncbi:MAG: hypothetical protein EHM72_12315, partial [Calditrichaeota bacterium]
MHLMRPWIYILVTIIFITAYQSAVLSNDQSITSSIKPTIISSDEQKIIFEINTPEMILQRALSSPTDECIIQIEGFAQTSTPGEPQVPLLGFMFGLPSNDPPQLVILNQEEETRRIPTLIPAPTWMPSPVVEDDDEIDESAHFEFIKGPLYARDGYYPENHMMLGATGDYRNHRLQTCQFYPILYNPVKGQIQLCRKMRAAVYFPQRTTMESVNWGNDRESDPLLQNQVINYDQAKHWHQKSLKPAAAMKSSFTANSQIWCKIIVEKAGIYKLDGHDLQEVGIDIDRINTNALSLYEGGESVALQKIGMADGQFDENDAIEFYAQTFKNYYTDDNIYWLSLDGPGGKDMVVVRGSQSDDLPILDWGIFRTEQEVDLIHRADFPGHTDNERWFMDRLYAPASVHYSLSVPNVDYETNKPCSLAFHIQAIASHPATPDHHTVIRLNGVQIYDRFWDGRVSLQETVTFASDVMKEGENDLIFEGPGDTESFLDWQLIDFYRIECRRKNIAVDNVLSFSTDRIGNFQIEIDGFGNDQPTLYDITDPRNPIIVEELIRIDSKWCFQMNLSSSRSLLALTETKKLKPPKIMIDTPSQLRASGDQVDYIVITVPEFKSALAPLLEERSSTGLVTEVIDIQDIYDEFSFGRPSERAIKDFVTYTFNHRASPAPRYLLLVGDASWNPRRLNADEESYGGNMQSDFIPTRFFESNVDHFEACSDNWFACIDGESDVLPDLLVGRLPARTVDQVQAMVEKLTRYSKLTPTQNMNKSVFIADIGEGGTLAFEDSSDMLIHRYIPDYFSTNRIYLSQLGMPKTREEIKSAFSDGGLTMNYFGHGSVGNWSAKSIFTRDDIPDLRESDALPFVLTMSCINGYFADPNSGNSSLAEMLFNQPQKGAIAVFSGSGEAFPSPLFPLARMLYESLYAFQNVTIGSFCTAGLFNLFSHYPAFEDHVRFYLLFGDPALLLCFVPQQVVHFAGLSGSVKIGGNPPPLASRINVMIGEDIVGSIRTISTSGNFGPIYIPADDTNTTVREGGVPGDTMQMVVELTDSLKVKLLPKIAWLPGQIQQV